tara:strand:+ start:43820 stop:44269 length:450 start_codon:yes stop_codon:yes gene_type:complete
MTGAASLSTAAESEIRTVIDQWQKAVVAGDLDRIMAHYADDILSFDAVAQLQFKGTAAYRKHWQACMEMCKGPMIFDIHELGVTANDDIAFSHYLTRCGGGADSGEEQTAWMRGTVCHRKIGGKWLVVHEHFSAPFDMQSSKALFDLKP